VKDWGIGNGHESEVQHSRVSGVGPRSRMIASLAKMT
jgi:hypothetical protein